MVYVSLRFVMQIGVILSSSECTEAHPYGVIAVATGRCPTFVVYLPEVLLRKPRYALRSSSSCCAPSMPAAAAASIWGLAPA